MPGSSVPVYHVETLAGTSAVELVTVSECSNFVEYDCQSLKHSLMLSLAKWWFLIN